MDELKREVPAWKKSPVIAGAMMLLKGYAPPVLLCDRCCRSLQRADQTIDVHFAGKGAFYDCPHCGWISERALEAPERG